MSGPPNGCHPDVARAGRPGEALNDHREFLFMNLFVLYTYIKARAATAEERGANLVEYILLVAFIALLVVAAVVGLKTAIKGKFDSSKNCLNTVSGTDPSC